MWIGMEGQLVVVPFLPGPVDRGLDERPGDVPAAVLLHHVHPHQLPGPSVAVAVDEVLWGQTFLERSASDATGRDHGTGGDVLGHQQERTLGLYVPTGDVVDV